MTEDRLTATLRGAERNVEPSPEFTEALLSEVREALRGGYESASAEKQGDVRSPRQWLARPRFGAAATVAAALVGAILLIGVPIWLIGALETAPDPSPPRATVPAVVDPEPAPSVTLPTPSIDSLPGPEADEAPIPPPVVTIVTDTADPREEPPPVSTTSTTMVTVDDPMTDRDIRQTLAENSPSPMLTNLEIGVEAPRFDAEVIYGADQGAAFDWNELRGRPALVLLWNTWADILEQDWASSSFGLNLSAYQETFDSLAGEVGFVSVVPNDDAETAVAVMTEAGHSFPVIAASGAIPWEFPEGPAWILLDDEGKFVDWFFSWGHARSGTAAWALPVNFLLDSLDGLPDVGVPPASVDESTGLTGNCVPALAVDTAGRLWALTPCGISVYDGAAWEDVPVEQPFYDGATTLDIVPSPDGSVWFLSVIVSDTDITHVAQYADGTWRHLTPAASFLSIAIASDGTPWAAAESQVLRLDGDRWEWMAGSAPNTADAAAIAAGPDGSVWVARESTIDRYDGSGWTSFSEIGEAGALPSGPSPWIRVGPDGDVWLADITSDGLLRYDGEAFTRYSFADLIGPVAFAPDGTVWTVSTAGPHYFDGEVWTRVYVAGALDPYLTSVAITPDGRVWFGSESAGIFEYTGDA